MATCGLNEEATTDALADHEQGNFVSRSLLLSICECKLQFLRHSLCNFCTTLNHDRLSWRRPASGQPPLCTFFPHSHPPVCRRHLCPSLLVILAICPHPPSLISSLDSGSLHRPFVSPSSRLEWAAQCPSPTRSPASPDATAEPAMSPASRLPRVPSELIHLPTTCFLAPACLAC